MRVFEIKNYKSHIYDSKLGVVIVKTSNSVRYFYTFESDFAITEFKNHAELEIDDDDSFEGTIQFHR